MTFSNYIIPTSSNKKNFFVLIYKTFNSIILVAEHAEAKKCFKYFTLRTLVQLSTGLLSLKTSKY